VNGSDGIGTGWSTSIPNFNPRDLVANIRRVLEGEGVEKMGPWYKNFKGHITAGADTRSRRSSTGASPGHIHELIWDIRWTEELKLS